MLPVSYNNALVVFSLAVAVLASYTALSMASRVASSKGKAAILWLVGGSFAMGFGIWSMHFIGMLAFSLPIPLGYDLTLTLISLLIAIASSMVALWVVCQTDLPVKRLVLGALLMGLGVASMHYLGMEAMLMMPRIVYDPWLFALSIVVAVSAAGAAIWIAFRLRGGNGRGLTGIGASLIMGCAIVGMHYTGMAAAHFPHGSHAGAANSGIDTQMLAVLVIVATVGVIAIALTVSMLDARASVLSNSLSQAHDELVRLALHDSLTHLPNRLLLDDRLDQAVQKAEQAKRQFAVLFMDLDGFKAINDAYGHLVGDRLLIEVAQRLRNNQRVEDTAARLGGDEFVVLLDAGDPDDAAVLAQRLIEELAEDYRIDGARLHISVSIGIAMFPDHGRTAHELMVNADAAMYHAKEEGRNGYRFFDTAMNTAAHQQRQMHQDLQRALDGGGFLLHYQPKWVAPSGPVTGVEALLRWEHPETGLLFPDRFLPLAERSGLIVPIGNWVINEACRQMREWIDQGYGEWSVAVNLSPVQLGHASLVDVVRAALERNSLPPRHLVLEITESTAMRDAEASLAILDRLVALGVSISIDDFGTGYSSLLYLKRLPAQELKIDRGFITELAQGSDDAAIISAIIALGKTLDLNIIAEGVENPEQRDLLTDLGCHALQGYLLGRPMPAERVLESLNSIAASREVVS